MISYLKGKIIFKGENFVILEVGGGVGYKIFVLSQLIAKIYKENLSELKLFTYLYVREDALTLFGFQDSKELEMFEALFSVTGIGPKSAMGILATSSVEIIASAIVSGDKTLLTKVSGVGKKTAERVILELRGKMDRFIRKAEAGEEAKDFSDAIEALVVMGYSRSQAREALESVPQTIGDVGERIKKALKVLGKKR